MRAIGAVELLGLVGLVVLSNIICPASMPAASTAPAPTSASVKAWTNPKDGLVYVWVPRGKFIMGCSPGDSECSHDEKPAHEVTLTTGFWLGQTEVTQAAYQKVTGTNPSDFQGPSRPVETVSYKEAQSYCKLVGGRLPTEAEWEYAARAGTTGARYGDLAAIAWYAGNSGGQTHDVATRQANAFGLYDMLGNVWEWSAEGYGNYATGPQSDPAGPASGVAALRGGSWDYAPSAVRASFRFPWLWGKEVDLGFRCAGEFPSAPRPSGPPQETEAAPLAPPAASTAPAPARIKTWTNPKDGLVYVSVPPGKFIMGCSPGDNQCDYNERPAHEVTLTKGFWLGQTEVTVGAYKRFAAAAGQGMPREPIQWGVPPRPQTMAQAEEIISHPELHSGRALNPGWSQDLQPMVEVSWAEAIHYCHWAGGTLPTEAQWEYAARAGTTSARYGELDAVAWYADNSGRSRLDSAAIAAKKDDDEYEQRLASNENGPHSVAQKAPNGFGLYDMLGNVGEWVLDIYDRNYYSQSPSRDPWSKTSLFQEDPGLRGGSWSNIPVLLRVSDRSGCVGSRSLKDVGFRCAVSKGPTPSELGK